MRTRRFFVLLALLAVALSMVGGTVSAQDTSMGVELNAEVSGDVEFWHFWGSPVRRNAVRRIVAMCQQALPNVTITEVFKPFGEIWTANIAAVAAGSGMPDVIVSDRLQLGREAAEGIYTNLQPYIDRDGVDSSRFYPFTWEQSLLDGEAYGIPFETDVRVLFYNKTLFEQAGLDPNDPPETWEELEAYADALDVVGEDGTIERIGFYPLINVGQDIWSLTNGVQWVDENGVPNVNQPGAVETLEWIQSWIERYGGYDAVQEFRASLGAAPNDAFMSGKVAMIADIAGYSSQLNFYRPRVTLDDESQAEIMWGIAPIPYNTTPTSWSGGFTLSIPTGSDNADAAWEVIKCISSPAGQSSWARDTYATPSDVSAMNDPILLADPVWQFIAEAMETSQSSTFVPEYANYMEQVNQRQEQVWRGEISAADALAEAQAQIEQTIADNS